MIQNCFDLNGEEAREDVIKGAIHEMKVRREEDMLIVACQTSEEILLGTSFESQSEVKNKVLNVVTGFLQV